jgi:hypothetical protein
MTLSVAHGNALPTELRRPDDPDFHSFEAGSLSLSSEGERSDRRAAHARNGRFGAVGATAREASASVSECGNAGDFRFDDENQSRGRNLNRSLLHQGQPVAPILRANPSRRAD